MASGLITVRLSRVDAAPWGFRLQGGKDFGTPLLIQKVNGGSLAERAGLIVGDALIKVNNIEVFNLRHKDAQDAIVRAGNSFELTLQRGPGATWKPAVTPVGTVPTPGSGVSAPVTKTSLAAGRPTGPGPIGTGHNINPRPFSGPQLNGISEQGTVKSITSKQYNNPVGIYSEETIAETLSAQAEVLAGGVLGVNFKKNEKSYNAANSEVLKMVQEIDKEPKEPEPEQVTGGSGVIVPPPVAGLRHVAAPEIKAPSTPQTTLPPGQNVCADCERLIVGVFVRIKDKNLHVECFKCATCGTSLKNVGYYNINNKLYCDIHAKLVARQNPPAPNLDPITVPPGARPPAGAISAAISSSMGTSGPLSPQPGTLAPMPFHAPRLATSHVNAPRPSPQTPTSTLGPKPFGAPAAPLAPFSTPAAPVSAPSSPFITPQAPALSTFSKPMPVEVGINNRRSSNQATDDSQTQPAPEPPAQQLSAPKQQTQQPRYQEPSEEIHPKPSPDQSTEDKNITVKENASSTADAVNNKDKPNRQMSLCSNEVCTIEEKKALLKIAAEAMGSNTIAEGDTDRPASPVPFQAEVSPSISTSNVVESVEITAQDISNKSQKVETCEEGNVQTVKTTKLEESYSSMSKMYSAELSTQSQVNRTSTPELEQIMEKKHAFPALHQPARPLTPSTLAIQRRIASQPARCLTPEIEQAMDKPHGSFSPVPPAAAVRPLSPGQVVVFPPEFPPLPPVSRSKHDSEHGEKKYISSNYESAKSQKERGSELVTKTQVEEIIKHELNKILSHDKVSHITPGKLTEGMTIAPDRPFTPVPLPQPISIPQPVPLPPETVPVDPSASQTSQNESSAPKKIPTSQMVQALTTAPERPYSPLPSATVGTTPFTSTSTSSFKPIQGDLPTLPKGAKPISMLSALTTAPETPYSLAGFSSPSETLQTTPSKIEPIQKYAPKPTEGVFKPIATPSAIKPSAVNPSVVKPSSTVAEVKPLPLPVPNIVTQEDTPDTQIKSFPPVSNELKSAFSHQSPFGPVKKSSSTAVSEKSSSFVASSEASYQKSSSFVASSASHQKSVAEITESHSFKALSVPSDDEKRPATPSRSRVSPFGTLQAPPLIPYYQQNIGEIPLAHRPKSPIPHAIRAPMINPPVEKTPKPPQRQVLSMAASYSQKVAAAQNQSSRVQSQSLNPSTVSFLHDQPKKSVPVLGYQPSPLVGKAPLAGEPNVPKSGIVPGSLDRTKQVFKPVIPSHESESTVIQSTHQTELNKTLNKSVPYFVKDSSEKENDVPVAPWRVVKVSEAQTTSTVQSSNISVAQTKTVITSESHTGISQYQQSQKKPSLNGDVKCNFTLDTLAAKSQQPQRKPSLNSDVKTTPKFEAPDPKKHSSVPELTVPSKPTSSSIPDAGPGGKTGTVAGTTAPRRGRGIMNPNVGIGARIPLCGQCHNQIRGPFITALGKIWCPEHFVCVNNQCRRPLQDIGFVEEAAGLYCEYCFEQYLAPTCNKCSTKIKGDCLNAIGKHFHPECFTCAYCGKLFGNSPFFLEDALPYCENDWNELFTTKCFSCGFPIEAGDRWVEALNNNYHSQCFNCTMCKKNLEGQSFYAKGGRPFCKNHAR